jgi:hypothetical protein
MAEATSTGFIVGLIMGNVARKPTRATCAAEGGGDAGAEAKVRVQAAAEGGESGEFFASGGIDDLPAEVGVTLESCRLGEGPAENDGIGVEHTSSSAGEGGEEVALILVPKVLGVLGLLGPTEGVGFGGAPGGVVAGLTNKAVGDSDVGDEVRVRAKATFK